MATKRILIGLVVLAVAALPAALAQDKADLKWKFEKDKTFYQELTTESTQAMKVMGQDVNQKQKQTFYFSWTPEKQDDSKNWIVKQKIIGVKIDIEIGGNKINYDSTNAAGAGGQLADFFKAMVGSEFTLTISPEMKVIKVEGREKFIDGLLKANPQIKPLLDQLLSDKALEQMSDPLFAAIPNKEVAKGDTWKREGKVALGPIGSYDVTHEYAFDGKEKDFDKIKVTTALKWAPPTDKEAQGLPFKIKSGTLEGKDSGGTILFDSKNGRIESMDTSVKLKGKLNIEIGGVSADVELEQSQTTKLRTYDKDPLTKK